MIKNHDLHLYKSDNGDLELSASDGVFAYAATFKIRQEYLDYCDEKADMWLHSEWGNFDGWSEEDRKAVADKWIDAKNLTVGKYNFYFNLGDIKDLFHEGVKELAKSMGIENYTLTVE